jgi:hypothetical protein
MRRRERRPGDSRSTGRAIKRVHKSNEYKHGATTPPKTRLYI